MPIDPVCGLVVPEGQEAVTTDYKGKHFVFCSEECKDEFDMDPEMYSEDAKAAEAVEEEESF